jgi:uncharacterized HAD superfamily protein
MNNDLVSEIAELGLNEVDLLAVVTDTSYEVEFYASVDGKRMQSNAMAEEGLVDSNKLFAFYEKVATVIRAEASFDSGALNVVKVSRNGEVSMTKTARNAHIYAIQKEWRNQVLNH